MISKQKNKLGTQTLLDLKTYYKPALITFVWYLCKYRNIEQKNRSRNGYTHAWLIHFQQKCQSNTVEKETLLNQILLEQVNIHVKKNQK